MYSVNLTDLKTQTCLQVAAQIVVGNNRFVVTTSELIRLLNFSSTFYYWLGHVACFCTNSYVELRMLYNYVIYELIFLRSTMQYLWLITCTWYRFIVSVAGSVQRSKIFELVVQPVHNG